MKEKIIIKKIKVAHILHSIGGVEVYMRLIVENCDPDLIENLIIHGQKNKRRVYKDKNLNKVNQFFVPIQREINIINDIKSVYETIKILKKEKPDIIHAHSAKGGIIGRLASFFYSVHVLHTPNAYSYLSTSNRYKRFVFLTIERILKLKGSILVACSTSELKRGVHEVKYKKSNTELFNNSVLPIDLKDNKSNSLHTWPEDYICTVGRPSYQKNIEMMIEVIKEVKKTIDTVHLVLMGVGEYYPNLESVKRLIAEYKLEDNITLVKWMNREEIFKIVSRSKFYISTARYEGLPYSIIESLALSKACVVTNCDGNRDLVIDQYNGFLIDNEDVKKMSERMIELYKKNDLRIKMESNSKKLFEQNFNLNNNIYNLESIYQKYSNH